MERGTENGNGFLAGFILGGLAGAGVMLVLAPRSGEETRAELQQAGVRLRDQAAEGLEAAQGNVTQARHKVDQAAADLRQKAGKFQKQAQEIFDDQRERLAGAIEGR